MAEPQVIKMATLTEMRVFAENNRAPGHPLRPVRDSRHIVYRPKFNCGIRRGRMVVLDPTSFEVYRGRMLFGTVNRMREGEWVAWTAEKGPGKGMFRRRSHAAAALLSMAGEDYICSQFSGLCWLLPNEMWVDRPDRRGPHWCHIARLGREHHCLCVCGIYLDLDRRRRGNDGG